MILSEREDGEIHVWLTNTTNPSDGYLCGFGKTKKEALELAMSCLDEEMENIKRCIRSLKIEDTQ